MTEAQATEQEPSPTILGLTAAKLRMTEGQLYTVTISALVVLLLTLTGLPNAHKPSAADGTTVPPVPIEEVRP